MPREDTRMNDTLSPLESSIVEPTAVGVASGDRNWAAAAHLSALVAALVTSWFAGVAGAVAAFVVWLLVRDKSGFAAAHAKEALNFNFSMFLYGIASIVLVVFTLGGDPLQAAPVESLLHFISYLETQKSADVPTAVFLETGI